MIHALALLGAAALILAMGAAGFGLGLLAASWWLQPPTIDDTDEAGA